MSTDSITLSPKLSRALRGLSHAIGVPVEDVIGYGMLNLENSVDISLLNCLESLYDFTPEQEARLWEVHKIARSLIDERSWDEFFSVTEGIPAFEPKDYAAAPRNIIRVSP
jgi:hypothetical protein